MRDKGLTGIVLLEAGKQETRYDTDTEIVFRQESYFNYLFGVRESDCFAALEVESGRCCLFMPKLHEAYSVWQGKIQGLEYYKLKYAVEETAWVDDMPLWLANKLKATKARLSDISQLSAEGVGQNAPLHVLYGQNTDSGNFAKPANFDGISFFPKVDKDSLFPVKTNEAYSGLMICKHFTHIPCKKLDHCG